MQKLFDLVWKSIYNWRMSDLSPSDNKNLVREYFANIDSYFKLFDEILKESDVARKEGRTDEAKRLLAFARTLLTNVKVTRELASSILRATKNHE